MTTLCEHRCPCCGWTGTSEDGLCPVCGYGVVDYRVVYTDSIEQE